jgi:hypothetical protein
MMDRRQFLAALVALAVAPAWAQTPAASEKELIEKLLAHIAGLDGASFFRNGKEFDARSASEYLRGKWGNVEGVVTAEDFITRVASVSSASGKPYLIRLKGGQTQKCGDYLRGVLATLK